MTAKSMTTYGNSRRSGGAGYFIKSGRTALLGSAAAIMPVRRWRRKVMKRNPASNSKK